MRFRLPVLMVSALVLGIFLMDLLLATRSEMVNYPNPAPDKYFYETGSDTADYPLDEYEFSSQVVILRSDNAALSSPEDPGEVLTPEEIEEMVYTVLEMDADEAAGMTNLQRVIADKRTANGNDSCWIALKLNLVYVPGSKHALSDQTDPRVAGPVLRYLVEETVATRVSLLACGGYKGLQKMDVFDKAKFSDGEFGRWNSFFPGLPDDFTLAGMVQEIRDDNPDKWIDMINLNYDELYENGLSYQEMTSTERRETTRAYIAVPVDNGIGALYTSNVSRDDGKYNPTKAIYMSDVVVNVPKMKTTKDVVVNAGFKNYIGSVSRGVYGYQKNRTSSLSSLDHTNLYETCLNLFSYHPSDYVLVDALHAMEGEGSHPYGKWTGYLKRNILVAGSDPVAVESVCARSMGFHPGDVEMLRYARAKGWGFFEPNRIKLAGDGLSSVTMDFRPAIGDDSQEGAYNYGRGCARWLLCGPFEGS
ncbi:MAG: DUF362 domain-containing protein, partial [Gemmatimonadota bacterium]|nr:DUF362 domain-containing protein [Gemmatimonadota bacterium]